MDNSFVKTPEEVCEYFQVDSSKGLNASQVKQQQEKFGKNGTCILFFNKNKYLPITHNSFVFLSLQSYPKKSQHLYINSSWNSFKIS